MIPSRCKDGESWPVDKAGNTYPGRTADEAWWEATRDDEWKYDVLRLGMAIGVLGYSQ